jgi:hypothetical protein
MGLSLLSADALSDKAIYEQLDNVKKECSLSLKGMINVLQGPYLPRA